LSYSFFRKNYAPPYYMKNCDLSDENEIANRIIGISLDIHRLLGPGLLESAYERVLAYELEKEGFEVKTQVGMPLIYYNFVVPDAYRADIIVNERVIIEIKSVAAMNNRFYKQLLTYLRLSGSKLGLLINFNVELLKDGISRVINGKI
jgi:GxxExxY protein